MLYGLAVERSHSFSRRTHAIWTVERCSSFNASCAAVISSLKRGIRCIARNATYCARRTARRFIGRNAPREYSNPDFIHKNKGWDVFSEADKAEYIALHNEFISKSATMLKEYEKSGSEELGHEISECIDEVDSARLALEGRAK